MLDIVISEHGDKSDRHLLYQLLANQYLFIQKFKEMSNELQNLKDAVAKALSLEELAITLLSGQKTSLDALKQQLADAIAANDPAAIQAVADSLNAESDKLNTAIAAIQPPTAPAPPAETPAA